MTCATQREMSPPRACSRTGLMKLSGVRGFFSKPRAFTKATIVRLDFPERHKSYVFDPTIDTRWESSPGRTIFAQSASCTTYARRNCAPRLRNIRCARRWTGRPGAQLAHSREECELQVTHVNAFRKSPIRCIAFQSGLRNWLGIR